MFNYIWPRLAVILGYIANYGYSDASGHYYISIDSDRCDGCGQCVKACLQNVFEVEPDDYDDPVARVRSNMTKELKYTCSPCKPTTGQRKLECEKACPSDAIKHSW